MSTPFTRKYVLGVTIDHQIRDIDRSLKKTLTRSQESGLSDETTREIVLTIQDLITFRQELLAKRKLYQ